MIASPTLRLSAGSLQSSGGGARYGDCVVIRLSQVLPRDEAGLFPKIIEDWQTAERIAASWVRRFGYQDAEVTPPGTVGIDVRGAGAVAQVKWWSKRVGIKDVQRLPGSAGPGQARFFFVRTGYTKAVYEWAADPAQRAALFILREDGRVMPRNLVANRVVSRTPFQAPAAMCTPMSARRKVLSALFNLYCMVTAAVCGAFLLGTGVYASVPVPILASMILGPLIAPIVSFPYVHRSDLRRFREARRRYKATGKWSGWRYIFTDQQEVRDAGLPCDLFPGRFERQWLVSVVNACDAIAYGVLMCGRWMAGRRRRAGARRVVVY